MAQYKIKKELEHLPSFPFGGRKVSKEVALENAEQYIKDGYGTYFEKVGGSSDEYVEPVEFKETTDDQLKEELNGKEIKFHVKLGRRKLIDLVLENRK